MSSFLLVLWVQTARAAASVVYIGHYAPRVRGRVSAALRAATSTPDAYHAS